MFCRRRSVTLLLQRDFVITAKFLRTLILKNICERLLVKISISVTNSESAAQALAQVFSCEFCEISMTIFFHRTPLVAASAILPKGDNS